MKTTADANWQAAQADASEWFNQARFGLFVHWGLYSLLAHESAEWVLFKSKLDIREYDRLADQFRPERFDADALAALAKRAGARYMVFTARHHDGFCMFDTKTNDFNSVKAEARRDFVKEYVGACRRAGLRVGLYYSIMSWQQPAIYAGPGADPEGWGRMVRETHAQVRELMSNYGRIDMLWYDGAVVPGIQDNGIIARFWISKELNAMARELQPQILINNRSGLPEDFCTPEQHFTPAPPGRRCEACMTINKSWGYNIHDRNFKSVEEIISTLIRCSRYGSNLLLNIGPRGDGSVQEECVARLEAVGRWLARNGESIYGSERSAYTEARHLAGAITQKGRRVYVHLLRKPESSVVVDAAGKVNCARILGSDVPLVVAAGRGASAHVSGFTEEMFKEVPAVMALALDNSPGGPAIMLGGDDEPRVEVADGPLLGEDPDRYAPPLVPVRIGAALAACLRDNEKYIAAQVESWCPGWNGWQVFTSDKQNSVEVALDASFQGRFDLDIGYIGLEARSIKPFLDGEKLAGEHRIDNPGCPDTCSIHSMLLSVGKHSLSLWADGRFGIYALRLIPLWRPVPMECWDTIGPFPTGFGPQKPVCEVRKAMERVFPPEEAYEPSASYEGVGGRKIAWVCGGSREGEHSEAGVNFPYRCGTDSSGVCYARTIIVAPEARRAVVMLGCDWWAKIWVNGSPVRSMRPAESCEEDGAQFSAWKPAPADVELQKGRNIVLVKCHPGSCANWFSFRISDPGDLVI